MEKNLSQLSKHFLSLILKINFIFCSRILENGIETVITEEDGVVKSKTVNGIPQSLEYRIK